MDERLRVKEPRREVEIKIPPQLPLLSVAWRILQSQQQRRAEEQERADGESARRRDVFVAIADEVFRLKRILVKLGEAKGEAVTDDLAAQMAVICERLEEALAKEEVVLIAPESQPYTDELMDLLENVAQRPDTALKRPCVDEVLVPAIISRGAVWRMGKAVIAVPEVESDSG